MLVGRAVDIALVFKGIEAVDRRLVGGDFAGELNFSNEGGLAVFADVALDEVKRRLLFLRKGGNRQTGLRLIENLP